MNGRGAVSRRVRNRTPLPTKCGTCRSCRRGLKCEYAKRWDRQHWRFMSQLLDGTARCCHCRVDLDNAFLCRMCGAVYRPGVKNAAIFPIPPAMRKRLKLAISMLTYGVLEDNVQYLIEGRGILKEMLGMRRVTSPGMAYRIQLAFRNKHKDWSCHEGQENLPGKASAYNDLRGARGKGKY